MNTRRFLLTSTLLLLVGAFAHADLPGFGRDRDHRRDRWDNGRRSYELLDQMICDLTHIKLVVTGDNATINDFDVVFGNNSTVNVPVRLRYEENSQTLWKSLDANARCVKGYDIDASSDRDGDRAQVEVWGLQKVKTRRGGYTSEFREVLLDTINLRENRGRRRHDGDWQPGRPGRGDGRGDGDGRGGHPR